MTRAKKDIKKVVLAYSGGLDTSIILKWLQTNYGAEVITFTADLGQGEELGPAREKALLLGVKPENIFIEDLREEFVRDYVFPMFRANAQYEGLYLLGTSIARPLIAKKQIEIARKMGAEAVCHGATGKGNDQVRFELGYYALEPDITVIAPWREWDFQSRTDLIAFAEAHQIPIAKDKRGEAPFSTDANLLHTSSEGKVLEDPNEETPDYVYSRTGHPEEAPDAPQYITIDFEKGDPVAIDGVALSPASLLAKLNDLGRLHGIGRLDLVENRFVGMKSRGMYETPGGAILLVAHRGMESLTLDRGAAHLKDELMPRANWCRRRSNTASSMSPGACASSSTRDRRRSSAARARGRSMTRILSPSRKAAPMTSATPRASSSSMRCACARWRAAPRAGRRNKRPGGGGRRGPPHFVLAREATRRCAPRNDGPSSLRAQRSNPERHADSGN